jgi:alpha-ribazole phosphatase
MNEPTTIWLVRHGLPEGAAGHCYGRNDIPLSPQGIRQANEISKQLEDQPLSHVYSSALRRAVETARVLAEPHHLTVHAIDEFAEIHFGDFEGLTYEEIRARYPDAFRDWMERPTETRFPNGESFSEMRTRVLRALELLLARHQQQSIAIVAHAGVVRILVAEALSIPHHQIFRLAQRYAAINRIDYFDHGAIVELING